LAQEATIVARYRANIQTRADPRFVFTYLSRFDRAADWDPGVSAGAMLTPEPVGIGSRFRLDATFLGRTLPLVYEITAFDAPRRIVLTADAPTFRSTDTIVVSEAPDADSPGTLVVYDAVLEAKGPLRIADPVLGLLFRRIGDRAASGLRERLNQVPLSSRAPS
jgi:Polyketide cyclase / dehydrase and lipid transport